MSSWLNAAALAGSAAVEQHLAETVQDYQASLVSVFAPDGTFARILSRGGEGPGEIDWPRMLAVSGDGRIAVASFSEVEIFDSVGTPLTTFRTQARINEPMRFDTAGGLRISSGPAEAGRHAPWTVPSGGIAAVSVVRGATDKSLKRHRFDSDGKETLSEAAPFTLDDLGCFAPNASQRTARICVGRVYQAFPWVDWLPDGRRIWGHTSAYRIDLEGPDSRLSIRPDRPRPEVSGALAAFLDDAWPEPGGTPFDSLLTTPTHKPAVAGVVPTVDGHLWVRLHAPSERVIDEDGEETWVETESRFDIFTPRGEHVGYVTGPADLTLRDVRGDTVLTTRSGPFDIPIVERFIIDWSPPN